jgi:hypothetical protein
MKVFEHGLNMAQMGGLPSLDLSIAEWLENKLVKT